MSFQKVTHIKITTYYNNQNKYIKLTNKKINENHKQIKHITLIIIQTLTMILIKWQN